MSDEIIDEQIPRQGSEESTNPPEVTEPVESDLKQEAENAKAEAEKWKTTAETYRLEIETKGLRAKKDRLPTPEKKDLANDIRRDYLSKRADIADEIREDINKLEDSEWSKIETLYEPAIEGVYEKAKKENRFVAKGEIQRKVSDLLAFARSGSNNDLEAARAEGAREMGKMENAEISGVKTRPSGDGVSDKVRKLAEEKGWDVGTAKTILENREKRAKEYAVR